MKKVSLLMSLLLSVTMLFGLIGPAMAEGTDTPLVVAQSALSGKFTPFFYDTAYDGEVVSMVSLGMMTLDRMGNIIFNGIEGETHNYGGVDYEYKTATNLSVEYDSAADITTYTCQIRDDLVFSDGVPVTADDIIFTYYVYADTDFDGSASFYSYPVIGMQNYRTQTTDDVFVKYNDMSLAIYEAGADHEWSEADAWTQEMQDWFWGKIEETWTGDVQAIVDYVYQNYAGAYAEPYLGTTAADVGESDGLKVALGMLLWGFADVVEEEVAEEAAEEEAAEEEVAEEAAEEEAAEEVPVELPGPSPIVGAVSGTVWSMEGDDMPTIADYYMETYLAYEGDPVEYWNEEAADDSDVVETTRALFVGEWGPKDEDNGEGGIPNIAGIKKIDDYTVQVQTKGYEAPAVYGILGHSITPLHYYGDLELYDYENNMFGFPRGDLSAVKANSDVPLGAGPYKFVEYTNKVAYFEANENYYKGAPETKYFQMKETLNNEIIPGIQTGAVDTGNINGSKKDFAAVASHNSNGEINGDVIVTSLVNNRGYGYIGMNSETVNVGGAPFSEASKNLRKALGTVLAVYRDVAYDSYYGEAAVVINYPISNVIWAAPQPTDEGYKVAFSVDVDGNDIYTSEMTAEDKYVVALETAVGFLKAAGYVFGEDGVITAAPEGAKLSYELTIPAEGTGDHPSFAVITDASNALATIGFDLKINDLSDSSILWDMLDAGTQELWAAAWQNNNPDPDMYQTYHSSNIVGKGGTDSNHYHIALPELDELIMEGRRSSDVAYRRSIYKQALDIIVDTACEVPAYQRQNAVIFSTERIDIDTLTPEITTWWGWGEEVYSVMMNANK